MILGYEREARGLVTSTARARQIRKARIEDGKSWGAIGVGCRLAWGPAVAIDDSQSFGATLCHVAAEMLGEEPDGYLWE